MVKSFDFVVRGTVQGVNFRSWTAKQAKSSGITGYVRNEASGEVTGHAEGDSDSLAKFAKALESGPSHAEVSDVEISNESEVERAQYSSFKVE